MIVGHHGATLTNIKAMQLMCLSAWRISCSSPCAVQARQALDVVSSLVQDLAPPDSAARPQRLSNADDSSSHEAPSHHARTAPEPKARARKAGNPAVKMATVPREVEKPRGRKVCA